MTPGKPKKKKCRNPACRQEFVPQRPMQVVCGPRCAAQLAITKRQSVEAKARRAEKAKHRAAKERIKTRSDYEREAQAVINRYARLRDRLDGCISCDKPASWQGQWHASHFRSRGAAPHLRFNLWNIHKACSICNNHKSGNLIEYRPALIKKIGADKVAWLESENYRAGHDIEYLKRLKRVFAKKCRRLEARL